MYSNEVQDLVLESYKRVTSYASDAIAHYEHFMDHMMPYIIVKNSRVDVPSKDGAEKHVVQLRNIVVHRPSIDDSDPALRSLKTGQLDPLYPSEARARGLTYSAQILVDVEHSVYEMNEGKWELKGTPVVFKEMPLFEMPVMLRSKYCYTSLDLSGECWMDLGGYFIIRGNAKVIQPQKVQRINVHLVKGQKHNQVDMDIRSLRADEKFRSTSTLYMHLGGSPPVITVDIPFLKSGLPVICLFRFLGVHDQEQIEALLNHQDEANRRLFAANYSSTCEKRIRRHPGFGGLVTHGQRPIPRKNSPSSCSASGRRTAAAYGLRRLGAHARQETGVSVNHYTAHAGRVHGQSGRRRPRL